MDTRYGKVEWGPGKPRSRTTEGNWKKPLTWNRWVEKGLCGACGHASDAHEGACTAKKGKKGKDCDCEGFVVRPRVFALSLGDIFDSEVPIEWLRDALELIAATPNLDWLLLTKRPKLWRKRLTEIAEMNAEGLPEPDGSRGILFARKWLNGAAPSNVWMGVAVESQDYAWRIDELVKIPAVVRFLSMEPLLGFIDLGPWIGDHDCHECGKRFWGDDLRGDHLVSVDYYDTGPETDALEKCPYCEYESTDTGDGTLGEVGDQDHEPVLHWGIVGGESGRQARPMHPEWAGSLKRQCSAGELPFHFKQHGAWVPCCEIDETEMGLYKSNRKAKEDEDQATLDELYGQTCKVPNGVFGIDGVLMDVVEERAYWEGRHGMLMFRVGKDRAGRLLGGREWNGIPE